MKVKSIKKYFVVAQLLLLLFCGTAICDNIADAALVAFNAENAKIPYYGWSGISDGGVLAWSEHHVLLGYELMYEVAEDVTYLRRFVEQTDKIFNNRAEVLGVTDAIRGRIVKAWPTDTYTAGEYCWAGHQGMITYPIARFVKLIESTPSLQAEFGAKAATYESKVIETVAEFDSEWRTSGVEGYYIEPAEGYQEMVYNLEFALGRTIVMLWETTGDSSYLDKATRLAKRFKNNIDMSNTGRYVWSYHDRPSGWGGYEDLSHGSLDVDFAIICYEAGIVFNQTDMQNFAGTLAYCAISNGSGGFYENVNRSGSPGVEVYSRASGEWGALGFTDATVRELVYNYFGDYSVDSSRWSSAGHVTLTIATRLMLTDPDLLGPADCQAVLDGGFGLAGDISGPGGEPDCKVDFYDLAELVENWAKCNDPANVICLPNW